MFGRTGIQTSGTLATPIFSEHDPLGYYEVYASRQGGVLLGLECRDVQIWFVASASIAYFGIN